MLTSVLSWAWIGSGVLLIVLVLLHSPKGGGMGGLAASGSSMFSSSSSAEATLNRITWTVLAVFLSLAVILSAGWLMLTESQSAGCSVRHLGSSESSLCSSVCSS